MRRRRIGGVRPAAVSRQSGELSAGVSIRWTRCACQPPNGERAPTDKDTWIARTRTGGMPRKGGGSSDYPGYTGGVLSTACYDSRCARMGIVPVAIAPVNQSTGQSALPVRPVPAGGPAVPVLLVVDKKVATLHIDGPHGRRASVTVHERRRLKRARRLPDMPDVASPTGRHARLRTERAPARCACGRRGRGRSKSKRLRCGPGSSTRRPCPPACRRGGS